jgi:hypothetical protein
MRRTIPAGTLLNCRLLPILAATVAMTACSQAATPATESTQQILSRSEGPGPEDRTVCNDPVFKELTGSAAQILRVGDSAQAVSTADIESFSTELLGGVKPWLIVGEYGQVCGGLTIQAYLPPEKTAPQLRRGKVVFLTNERGAKWAVVNTERFYSSNDETVSGRWSPRVRYSGTYVQTTIQGRSFDRISDANDRNRPFFITGEFSDDELLELISFVRQDLPILSVFRQQGGAVTVCFRQASQSWDFLELRRDDKGWVAVRSASSQA